VRRLLPLLVGLFLLPSVLAAGLGLWNPIAAQQEHLGLELLLQLLLQLEESALHARLVGDGLVGGLEVGLLLGGVFVFLASCPLWETRLPRPLAFLVALAEAVPAVVALVVSCAVIAVASASARPLFWACAAAGLAARRGYGPPLGLLPGDGWTGRSNRFGRVASGVFATALAYYGVTSLWEGATYQNPIFGLQELWATALGSQPLLAGGAWGCVGGGLGALLFWTSRGRSLTQDRLVVTGLVSTALLIAFAFATEPIAERRWPALLAGVGLVALAGGLGARSRTWFPDPISPWALLDPRRLFAAFLPLLFGSCVLLVCSMTLNLWTPVSTLPPGVTKISDADCVFSLGIDRDDHVFFTDRCAVRAGIIEAGTTKFWPLAPQAASAVEELGGPDAAGTFWAAIQAYALEAQLVLLAIEGRAGPRSIDPAVLGIERARSLGLIDESGAVLIKTLADKTVSVAPGETPPAAQIPLPDCWISSWIPLPETSNSQILLGCENRNGGLILDTNKRKITRSVDLAGRLESGTFSPKGNQLFGVSLWSDPFVHAFSWPEGQELARRRIEPFNWDVLTVPSGDSYQLWVPRFIEGMVLILDPNSLETKARIPLSFGIRAAHYEPVFERVWAAASYSGELWSIATTPPYDRRVFPLCGQTRDLVSDRQGGVIASTDCGVFRFDTATLLGEPPP